VTPSVTYFHNDIHGEIANALLPSGNFMEENVNQATTDGVEVGLEVKPWLDRHAEPELHLS
jgi:outer membrane receptor for ferrienterochelin and colicin